MTATGDKNQQAELPHLRLRNCCSETSHALDTFLPLLQGDARRLGNDRKSLIFFALLVANVVVIGFLQAFISLEQMKTTPE